MDKETGAAQPTPGMPVFTTDGTHLGHVREVDPGEGWFKIDVQHAPDFWLPLSDIQEVAARYVLLKKRKSELRQTRWEGNKPERPLLSPDDDGRYERIACFCMRTVTRAPMR